MVELPASGTDVMTTAGLVAVAGAGAWYDVRERRVPNALTLGGLVLGLALGALGGVGGFATALAGAGLGLLVALPLFLLGGLGGGDVKLLTALGAFLGPARLPVALVATALVGGVMAAVEVIRRRAVRRTIMNLWVIIMSFGRKSFGRWKWRERESGAPLTVDDAAAVTIPYAVAISVGAVAACIL